MLLASGRIVTVVGVITKVAIENFKSIKALAFSPRRVNCLIGEPGSGKSNILEAMGLLSCAGHDGYRDIDGYVRFEHMADLFANHNLGRPITITVDNGTSTTLSLRYNRDWYRLGTIEDGSFKEIGNFTEDGDWNAVDPGKSKVGELNRIRFYRYLREARFDDGRPGSLRPPSGKNLFAVTQFDQTINALVSEIFKQFDLRLSLRSHEKSIEAVREVDDVFYTYPYITLSDTMKRTVFHRVAIASNEGATILFEEPETHAFPLHTKHLGERIARNERNQYFIATHNPYLFSALVEKTAASDLAVFLTFMRDHITHIHRLMVEDLEEMLGYEIDPFFNLDRYRPSEGVDGD